MRSVVAGGLLLLIPLQAVAQESPSHPVRYCVEDASAGFHSRDGEDDYEQVAFNEKRFTIRVEESVILVSDPDSQPRFFDCRGDILGQQPMRFCQSAAGSVINLNAETGRFVRADTFGHVFSRSDSLSVSYGTCTTF